MKTENFENLENPQKITLKFLVLSTQKFRLTTFGWKPYLLLPDHAHQGAVGGVLRQADGLLVLVHRDEGGGEAGHLPRAQLAKARVQEHRAQILNRTEVELKFLDTVGKL